MLVRSMFSHPERSFVHNTDDPNAATAIHAGELVSGHPSLEHRYWKVALELLYPTCRSTGKPCLAEHHRASCSGGEGRRRARL